MHRTYGHQSAIHHPLIVFFFISRVKGHFLSLKINGKSSVYTHNAECNPNQNEQFVLYRYYIPQSAIQKVIHLTNGISFNRN